MVENVYMRKRPYNKNLKVEQNKIGSHRDRLEAARMRGNAKSSGFGHQPESFDETGEKYLDIPSRYMPVVEPLVDHSSMWYGNTLDNASYNVEGQGSYHADPPSHGLPVPSYHIPFGTFDQPNVEADAGLNVNQEVEPAAFVEEHPDYNVNDNVDLFVDNETQPPPRFPPEEYLSDWRLSRSVPVPGGPSSRV